MSESNRNLIHRLYTALDRRDGETMAACYHPDATFKDPVFTLKGEEVGDMWRMLTSRAADLRCEARDIVATGESGQANWVATYTYSGTGRKVENRIASRFRFREGLIVEQVDTFDLWRWLRQALGPVGLLFGWSPSVRSKVRKQARLALDKYRSSRTA